MKMIEVLIRTRYNHNPESGPLGAIGYLATARYPFSSGWRGCPMGRAATKEGAVRDLLRRANAESGTSVTEADLEITDRTT